MRQIFKMRGRDARIGIDEERQQAQNARMLTGSDRHGTNVTVANALALAEHMRNSREMNHYSERIALALAAPPRKKTKKLGQKT